MKAARYPGVFIGMFLKTLVCLLAIGCLSHPRTLWANFSGWASGVVSTGNASPSTEKRSTNITIEEENLTINLHQEFAAVEVRYQMRNTGDDVNQGFFFPVETEVDDLENYQVFADGKEYKWETVESPKIPEIIDEEGNYDAGRRNPIKSWKKSTIAFASGQTREIVVRYNARYDLEGGGQSDDDHWSPARFAYSLSPAATWKGPIGKGRVVINIVHPLPEDVVIYKPADRFAKINDRLYEWSFTDLKPTQDDDLFIRVHKGEDHYERSQSTYILRQDSYYLRHTEYDVKAGKDSDYNMENLKYDNDIAWAAGGSNNGIGESLTFTVNNPLPLDAIFIMPGYDSTDKSFWWKYNRVAQLKITLNGEHTFDVAIPDERFKYEYPIVIRDYNKPVKKIRMEITGVHRGTHYKNTCISLIQLQGKLAKKPIITGSR